VREGDMTMHACTVDLRRCPGKLPGRKHGTAGTGIDRDQPTRTSLG
jgi:hypothetical protein